METIKLIKNQKYYNFVENSEVTETLFTPKENSDGIFIALEKTGPKAYLFGSAKKYLPMRTRNITIEDTKEDLIVNGVPISGNSTWIKSEGIFSEAFVKREGKKIKVSFATKGYLCINNNLIIFDAIKFAENIPLKTRDGKNYIKSKEIAKIFLNGEELILENDDERYFIPNGYNITENFYVELKNGQYSNITIPFIFPTIYSVVGNPVSNFCENFRCSSPNINPVVSNEKIEQKVEFSITRFNNESLTMTVLCKFVSLEEYRLLNIVLKSIHQKQEMEVDYGIYPSVKAIELEEVTNELEKKTSLFGSFFGTSDLSLSTKKREITKIEGLKVYPTSNVTFIKCLMNDDSFFTSKIIRPTPVINLTKGEIKRYTPGVKTEFLSDEYFIHNDKLIFQKNSKKISVLFNEGDYSITLFNSETQTWTEHEVRQETLFNKKYIKEVYTKLSPVFLLTDLGWYDTKDTFKYFINGEHTEKPKYYINTKNQKTFADGRIVLEEVKFSFSRQHDKKIFDILVVFIFNDNLKTSFLLEDNDIFGKSTTKVPFDDDKFNKSMTRFVFGDNYQGIGQYATYGSYIINDEESFLFQNSVSMNSKIFKKFPIINFNTPLVGEIKTCQQTLPIKSLILGEEMKIPLTTNSYVRLNHCSDVQIKNSILIVPKHTSLSFFIAEDNIYLIKSSLVKDGSQASFSGILERRRTLGKAEDFGSFSAKADPGSKPSAEPEQTKSPGLIGSLFSMFNTSTEKTDNQQKSLIEFPTSNSPIGTTISVKTTKTEVKPNNITPKVNTPIKSPTEAPRETFIARPVSVRPNTTYVKPVTIVKPVTVQSSQELPHKKIVSNTEQRAKRIIPAPMQNKTQKQEQTREITAKDDILIARSSGTVQRNEGKIDSFESKKNTLTENGSISFLHSEKKKNYGEETIILSRESQNFLPTQNFTRTESKKQKIEAKTSSPITANKKSKIRNSRTFYE